ncbi:hypothetical protein NDU88_002428 [Pleurodeles waltl]|uniref:Uncharacterized protein n=1 Tax=Pleurodeles waltl TaxID=8319 RepID=A0AAV7LCH4_PLEWA|nr:hypothetical protein NDU88_002428 [Pleurodeles waltl]
MVAGDDKALARPSEDGALGVPSDGAVTSGRSTSEPPREERSLQAWWAGRPRNHKAEQVEPLDAAKRHTDHSWSSTGTARIRGCSAGETPTTGKIHQTQIRRAEWLQQGERTQRPSDSQRRPGPQWAAVGVGSDHCWAKCGWHRPPDRLMMGAGAAEY